MSAWLLGKMDEVGIVTIDVEGHSPAICEERRKGADPATAFLVTSTLVLAVPASAPAEAAKGSKPMVSTGATARSGACMSLSELSSCDPTSTIRNAGRSDPPRQRKRPRRGQDRHRVLKWPCAVRSFRQVDQCGQGFVNGLVGQHQRRRALAGCGVAGHFEQHALPFVHHGLNAATGGCSASDAAAFAFWTLWTPPRSHRAISGS